MLPRRLTAFAVLNLVMWSPASRVLACSCTTEYLYWTLPADGALDVPTDVVIWASAAEVREWHLKAEDGEDVPVEVEEVHPPFSCRHGQSQITPVQELRPQTRYELQARWGGSTEPASRVFTTGAGPLRGAVQDAPKGAEVALMEPEGDCCNCVGYHAYVCIRGVPTTRDGGVLELAVRDPSIPSFVIDELAMIAADLPEPPVPSVEEVAAQVHPVVDVARYPQHVDFHWLPYAVPACVELTYRAADGSHSKPLELCDAELAVVPFSEEVSDCNTLFNVVDGDLVLSPKPPAEKDDAGTRHASSGSERDAEGGDPSEAKRDENDVADHAEPGVKASSGGCDASGRSHVPGAALLSTAAVLLIARRRRHSR